MWRPKRLTKEVENILLILLSWELQSAKQCCKKSFPNNINFFSELLKINKIKLSKTLKNSLSVAYFHCQKTIIASLDFEYNTKYNTKSMSIQVEQ